MEFPTGVRRWLLVVPSTYSRNLAGILALSALAQGFFLLTAYYCVPGGAQEFVVFGRTLLSLFQGHHIQVAPTVASRNVGYPLLLVLSGLFHGGSLIGITVIQSSMAMLIPVLIYLTVLHTSFTGAYYIALASMVSLGPFLFTKWLHHDQTYIFLSIVIIWTFSRFVHTKKSRDLLWLGLAIIATSLTRPAGDLLFPVLIVVAYVLVRGPIGRYIWVIALCIVVMFANHYLRQELFYYGGTKPNAYIGGQVFYNLYMNSAEYGIRLSGNPGPAMREVTDNVYRAMLPRPRSSRFLNKFLGVEEPPSDFRDKVVIPFAEKYYYPYSAEEFREQLYRTPNWEYYLLILDVNPDPVLLRASWEIARAYPLLPIRLTARNLWYFLYKPGYFHTRYNPAPIFRGGLFYPPDGQAAIGGAAFGASAAILGLPPRAATELAFDSFKAQPNWLRRLYLGVRMIWLRSYNAVARGLFFLIAVAWLALIADWATRLSRFSGLRRWSDAVGAGQLTKHVLYVSVFLLYNAAAIAAFAEPDYRYSYMTLLVEVVLAGLGGIVLARLAWEFLRPLVPPLSEGRHESPALALDPIGASLIALAVALAVAVCAGWAWYMSVHAG